MPAPSWLPPTVPVDGDWNEVLRRLYWIFLHDFVETGPLRCRKLIVKWDTNILGLDNCCEGFWHLITKTDRENAGRLFDPRRAERLPWAAPIISHSGDLRVKYWEYLESSRRIRIYIWVENLDYVVILEKQPKIAWLITAFYIEGNSKRGDLTRKYEKRIKTNAAH